MLAPRNDIDNLMELMLDTNFVFTDNDVLYSLRYIKYTVCKGNNRKFKDMLIPIFQNPFCRVRFGCIGKMVMSPDYKKPKIK